MQIKDMLAPLGTVAQSPLALVAYVVAIVAWASIAWQVKSSRDLLKHLEKFPEKDRRKVFIEARGVLLKEGLAPEQYLRSRIHQYYFVAFLALVVASLVFGVAVVYSAQRPGKLSVVTSAPVAGDEDLGYGGIYVSPGGVDSVNEETRHPDLEISYSYSRRADTLSMTAQLPYLERIRRGQMITAVEANWDGYFYWRYPKLSVQAANNSGGIQVLTEALISVLRIDPITEPVPVIDGTNSVSPPGDPDVSTIGLNVLNDGWGTMHNVVVDFEVLPESAFQTAVPGRARFPHRVHLGNIAGGSERGFTLIDVDNDTTRTAEISNPPSSRYSPRAMLVAAYSMLSGPTDQQGPNWVTAIGRLTYRTETGQRRSVPFRTAIDLLAEYGGGFLDSSQTYSVCLPATQTAKKIYHVGLSQSIEPAGADRFDLRLGSDRSARYVLALEFRTAGGARVPGGVVEATLLVPASRDAAKRRCKPR